MDKKIIFTGMNKTRRDRKVKRFHEAHPDATLQEIGDKFGITKQMVFLILKESKSDTLL
jgi:DNA-directed RNA polymerase sigma subunit (sigma70/sigma32)